MEGGMVDKSSIKHNKHKFKLKNANPPLSMHCTKTMTSTHWRSAMIS
jgi:hypothetical protein